MSTSEIMKAGKSVHEGYKQPIYVYLFVLQLRWPRVFSILSEQLDTAIDWEVLLQKIDNYRICNKLT